MSTLVSPGLEATAPAEERGRRREDVRLLVARQAGVEHRRFADLPGVLEPGDLLVVNTSPTLAASLEARTLDGTPAELHLSTEQGDGQWIVELRHTSAGPPAHRAASTPWLDAEAGTELRLDGGARARLLRPAFPGGTRLWVASLELPVALATFLPEHGRAIRYGYVAHDYPLSAYQTVFADPAQPGGSAEMPSAARPSDADVVARLALRGVGFARLRLHTGVSSPEAHEPPSPERYEVPRDTAELVNLTHRLGHRVIAVGTTAVRALETVTTPHRLTRPGRGWTSLVVSPERGVFAVDGLITGWHEPQASHLDLIEAVACRSLTRASYRAARRALATSGTSSATAI